MGVVVNSAKAFQNTLDNLFITNNPNNKIMCIFAKR